MVYRAKFQYRQGYLEKLSLKIKQTNKKQKISKHWVSLTSILPKQGRKTGEPKLDLTITSHKSRNLSELRCRKHF